jgi:hypothetical protein
MLHVDVEGGVGVERVFQVRVDGVQPLAPHGRQVDARDRGRVAHVRVHRPAQLAARVAAAVGVRVGAARVQQRVTHVAALAGEQAAHAAQRLEHGGQRARHAVTVQEVARRRRNVTITIVVALWKKKNIIRS